MNIKLVLVVLVRIQKSLSMLIDNMQFGKTAFDPGFDFAKVNGCPVKYTNASSMSKCSSFCMNDPKCTGYQFQAKNSACQLLSYDLATPMASNGSNDYYAITLTVNSVDVARNKIATGASTFEAYSPAQTMVSGVTCGTVDKSCWCSGAVKSVTIGLGDVYTIQRIIITRYIMYPSYMNDIKIYIGNAGSTSDPIFGQIGTANAYKSVVTGSASGKYIYIHRYPTDNTNSLCLCLVEAFEF